MSESTRRRAWQDTERFRESPISFWGVEVVGAASLGLLGGMVGFWLKPTNSTSFQQFLYPAVGSVIGIIAGFCLVFAMIYVWNFFRAPYRQRNESIVEVLKVKQEYDALKRKYEEKKQDEFHFEFNDNSVTCNDGRLLLGVTFFSPTDMIVDDLYLECNGKQFQPSDWAPFKLRRIHSKMYTFELSKIQAVSPISTQDARFVVLADNIKHESLPFNIYQLL